MSIISNFKEQVNNIIDDFGSDITFTPISKSSTYGGYAGSESESTANAITTKAIPSTLISRQWVYQKFGDAEEGTSRVIIKEEVSLTSGTEYKVTWKGLSWDLLSIQDRGHIQNDSAFKVVTLKKQI